MDPHRPHSTSPGRRWPALLLIAALAAAAAAGICAGAILTRLCARGIGPQAAPALVTGLAAVQARCELELGPDGIGASSAQRDCAAAARAALPAGRRGERMPGHPVEVWRPPPARAAIRGACDGPPPAGSRSLRISTAGSSSSRRSRGRSGVSRAGSELVGTGARVRRAAYCLTTLISSIATPKSVTASSVVSWN